MKYQIEKNIPVQTFRTGITSELYGVFSAMEVGDSVLFGDMKPSTVTACASMFKKNNPGVTFITRSIGKASEPGVRAWRVS